jgi:hypothetical protein
MVLPNLVALTDFPVPTGMAPKQVSAGVPGMPTAESDEAWLDTQDQRRINQYRSLESMEDHSDRVMRIELMKPTLFNKALDVGGMLAARMFETVRSRMDAYMQRTRWLLDGIVRNSASTNYMHVAFQLQRAIVMMERYVAQGPRHLQAHLVDGDEGGDEGDEDDGDDEEVVSVLYLRAHEDAIGPRVPEMVRECQEVLVYVANLWYQHAHRAFEQWDERFNAEVLGAIRNGDLNRARKTLVVLKRTHAAVCLQMKMAALVRQRVLSANGMGLEDALEEDVKRVARTIALAEPERGRQLDQAENALYVSMGGQPPRDPGSA